MKFKKFYVDDEGKDAIEFDDGTKIECLHYQDCCENVYADFKQLKDTTFESTDFKNIVISGVRHSGIKINGYFIPCYNEQNGYYNSDLEIITHHPEGWQSRFNCKNYIEDIDC